MPRSRVARSTLAILLCTSPLVACADDGGGAEADGADATQGPADTTDADSSADGDGSDGSTGDPAEPDGAMAFASRCAGCHGAMAEGTAAAPTNRNPHPGFAAWVVRNGRDDLPFPGAMPMFTTEALSDAELDAIVQWLRTFENPPDGEGLFVRFCANCHGPDAQGGRVGVDLTHEIASKTLAEVIEQVREGEGGTDYGARTLYMRAFTPDELSDDEVALIADHVLGLPPGPGDD